MRTVIAALCGVALAGGLVAHSVLAQPAGRHHHGTHGTTATQQAPAPATAPTMPGQDAFGAMAEVVRLLDADPATDWTKVNLESLRQHLIDMNEVVLRSQVIAMPVPGGLAMTITGTDRTAQAIQAMVVPHAAELERLPPYSATAEVIPGGVKLTVVSRTPDDARSVARLRGLGFAGLLTEGGHHGPHHLAMAKGEMRH